MTDHAAIVMAFAKGNKNAKPTEEALMSALLAGLCTRTMRIRLSRSGEDVRTTWRLTETGMALLRQAIDRLPPHARPTAVKRRRQRPVKRRPSVQP